MTQKTFFSVLLLFLSMVLSCHTHAEQADANKPINIASDQLIYDDVKKIKTILGNVIITRGTLIMKAEKVLLTEDAAGHQFATLYAAPGSLATFRQKRDGNGDLWVEGAAERIEYDGKVELAKFFSKAKLKRLEGRKTTDEVEGEFISYDSRTEFFTVNNTTNGNSRPNAGRVKVVIQPRTTSQETSKESTKDTTKDTTKDK